MTHVGRRRGRRGQRAWTLAAPVYDRVMAACGWHAWQDRLLTDVTSGRLLDVGCGPAHPSRRLRARGVAYVGLDLNPAMAARARGAVPAAATAPGAIVQADVAALPFADRSFDVVVATAVLGLLDLPARHAALKEMARVARREVRMLEPIGRPGGAGRTLSRLIAFAREQPISLDELQAAGLRGDVVGGARYARVYSEVRATPDEFASGEPSRLGCRPSRTPKDPRGGQRGQSLPDHHAPAVIGLDLGQRPVTVGDERVAAGHQSLGGRGATWP